MCDVLKLRRMRPSFKWRKKTCSQLSTDEVSLLRLRCLSPLASASRRSTVSSAVLSGLRNLVCTFRNEIQLLVCLFFVRRALFQARLQQFGPAGLFLAPSALARTSRYTLACSGSSPSARWRDQPRNRAQLRHLLKTLPASGQQPENMFHREFGVLVRTVITVSVHLWSSSTARNGSCFRTFYVGLVWASRRGAQPQVRLNAEMMM